MDYPVRRSIADNQVKMDDQINPKLQHLSATQTQELMSRYYDGELVEVLLQDFKIDCFPSHLYRLFPPVIDTEKSCPYCKVSMLFKATSRSSSRHQKITRHCPSCEHNEGGRCQCSNCIVAKASEYKRQHSEQSQRVLEFCQQTWPSVKTRKSVCDLSLREAVALLSLTRACVFVDPVITGHGNPDSMTIEALEHATVPFAPEGDLGLELIRELRDADLIGMSELSNIDAFKFEGADLTSYYPSKIRWAITHSDPQLLLSEIEQIAGQCSDWPTHWSDDVEHLWFEIAFAESKEFYRYSASARDLPESGVTSTNTMLRNLLQSFSVSKCYRIIWAGATAASDYLLRKKCTRPHASNYMIGACQRWADRARAENWGVTDFKRNFSLPRSSISHTFFDLFLKIGEAGFNSVPAMSAKQHGTLDPSQQNKKSKTKEEQ